jgi:hypothetical protein
VYEYLCLSCVLKKQFKKSVDILKQLAIKRVITELLAIKCSLVNGKRTAKGVRR